MIKMSKEEIKIYVAVILAIPLIVFDVIKDKGPWAKRK